MKRLLLLAIIFCSTIINAQEFDSQLFQTWYLVQNYETEGNQEYIVADIEPEIVPTITFYDNLTFYGIGACNGFSGTIGHDNYNYPVVTSFLPSLSVCDDTIHNSFESMYFDFLGGLFHENFGGFTYDITSSADGLGLELTMHSPLFNGLIFRNYVIPEPQLFQTWFLRNIQYSDAHYEYQSAGEIPNEIPPNDNLIQIQELTPTLTIQEDYTYSGVGACNTFNGTLNFNNDPNINRSFIAFNTSNTDNDCGSNTYTDFENDYFIFLQIGGWYSIIPEDSGDGLTLFMHNPIFGHAIFTNYPLSVSEKQLQDIKLTFNPEHTKLYVNDSSNSIDNIKIYNTYGQSIKSISNNFNTIDIATLATGIYLVKIETSLGTVTKKVIKK